VAEHGSSDGFEPEGDMTQEDVLLLTKETKLVLGRVTPTAPKAE
jgi:hypothetical protein